MTTGLPGAFPRALLIVMAFATAVGISPAFAASPLAPCDYERLWPIGSYEKIPKTINTGSPLAIKYSYSWDLSAPTFDAWEMWSPPRDCRMLPPEQQQGMPTGYVGSTTTLRLPQEITIEDWETHGFEKNTLWIDANGHATHEYTRLNAHAPGTLNGEIQLLLTELPRYPNTEIIIDLGIRDAHATMPAQFFINPDGQHAVSIGDHIELAAGQAAEPGRGVITYPPPIITPIREWDLGTAERATLSAFLESNTYANQAHGSQSKIAPTVAYVYGYLSSIDRTGTANAAADIRVCLHDASNEGTSDDPLIIDGEPACTHTNNNGFYGLTVPTADPDGDETADIVARLSLIDKVATILNRGYDLPVANNISGPLVSLGTAFIPPASNFQHALVVYSDVHRAHEYFDTLGHAVPHVQIRSGSPAYERNTATILTQLGQNYDQGALFHEYAHHVMHSTYPAGTFTGLNCFGHTIDGPVEPPACVWTESWATFAEILILNSPTIPFIDFERRALIDFTLESASTAQPGSNREINVIAALWDLYDDSNTSEQFDNVSVTPQEIVDVVFSESEKGEITPIRSIHEFRDAWHDQGLIGFDSLLNHNAITPEASAPAALTVDVLNSDRTTKSETSKKHAKAGDIIVIHLRLEQPGTTSAPTITFAGSSASPMSPGASSNMWSYSHTVSDSTPEGHARFTIVVRDMTGTASFSEYGITDGKNAVIDTTQLAPPVARFVSPTEILLDFRESLNPFLLDQSEFSITPPAGEPVVITPSSTTDSAVRLLLSTSATNGDQYTIDIPQTVTDLAGNTRMHNRVMITLDTDDAPPTFSAVRYNRPGFQHPCGPDNCEILITFSEPVRAMPNGMLVLEDWTFIPARTDPSTPSAPRTPEHISTFIDHDRLTIGTHRTTAAGSIKYTPTTTRPIEDMDGNPLLTTSVQVSASPSLVFVAEARRNGVYVSFPLFSGKTNAAEWLVGGTPATSILDPLTRTPLAASPSGDVTIASRSQILLSHSLPTSISRPLVEYVKPGGANANSLSANSGGMLQSSSYLAQDELRPRLVSASFIDAQTISLVITEALDASSVEATTFTANGDLGELTPSYTEGSTTITLSTAAAALDNTIYTVRIVGSITDLAGHGLVQRSFTTSRNDDTGPVALDAYFAGDDRSRLAFTVNEALRPDTVTSADFDVTAKGSDTDLLRLGSRASYEPLSRTVWLRLAPLDSLDQRLTITIPTTVLDIAGNIISTRKLAVPHIQNEPTIASHVFVDPNTIVYKLRAPLDASSFESAAFRLTPSLGRLTAVYEEDSFEFHITTSDAATTGTAYKTTVTGLTDVRGGRVTVSGTATYSGTGKPVPLSAASTSPTTTEVRFGVPVQFGVDVTLAQHRLHWAVSEGGAAKTIGGIAAKAGDPLTLVITHDPLSGASATATVTYTGTPDDAGRVRDTATTPSAQEGGPFRLAATDGASPTASSLALSIERAGEARPGATHARAGDDVIVRLALSEPAAPPGPRLVVLGSAVDMALAPSGDRSAWTGRYTVPASPPQGQVLFGVTVRDGADNEATIDRASLTSGNAILDTVAPTFTASTRSATQTAIAFAEPVHGSLVASDWTVGTARALGVAPAGGGATPQATLALPAQAPVSAIVLTHPPLADTGTAPAVAYSPPGPAA